jgi:ankyrin repeat protein
MACDIPALKGSYFDRLESGDFQKKIESIEYALIYGIATIPIGPSSDGNESFIDIVNQTFVDKTALRLRLILLTLEVSSNPSELEIYSACVAFNFERVIVSYLYSRKIDVLNIVAKFDENIVKTRFEQLLPEKYDDTRLLLNACENGRGDIASKLLNLYHHHNLSDCLIEACRQKLTTVALAIIELGLSETAYDKTLMIACDSNQQTVANALITTGKCTNIDAVLAVTYPSACRQQLEINLIKYATMKLRIEALRWACMHCQQEFAEALLQSIPHDEPLPPDTLILACKNTPKLTRVALELIKNFKRVDLSYVDDTGETALIVACKNSNNAIAWELVIRKSNQSHPKNLPQYQTPTALMWACRNSLKYVALKLLATNDSNPGHEYLTETALLWACKNRLNDVALTLIGSGEANCRQVLSVTGRRLILWHDITNATALVLACINSMNTVALKLIEQDKTNLDIVSSRGTPKQCALQNKMKDLVAELEKWSH